MPYVTDFKEALNKAERKKTITIHVTKQKRLKITMLMQFPIVVFGKLRNGKVENGKLGNSNLGDGILGYRKFWKQ